MPNQFHPRIGASSTREDLGFIKHHHGADTDDVSAVRVDLFPIVDTDDETPQFADDDFRQSEDVASPVELFGEQFVDQPKAEMPKNPAMRLSLLAILGSVIRYR